MTQRYAYKPLQRPRMLCSMLSRGQANLFGKRATWTRIAAGWIVALTICHTLSAQMAFRPSVAIGKNTTGAVTLQELEHVVPKSARAENDKAAKAMLKHDWKNALGHLRKAIAIDPEFVEARNNAGICLFFSDPVAANVEWEEAIKIDPHKGVLYKHLAVANAAIRNLEAAERSARIFLALDGTNEARALVGLVLHEEEKYTAETLGLLERSAADYPIAHFFAARVLLYQGQSLRAKEHLRTYLSRSETERRQEASELLDYIDGLEQAQKLSRNQ